MTNDELQALFEKSLRRSREIEAQHRAGVPLTRRDCLELRECNARLHVVGHEMWVRQSKPPGFDVFERPHRKRPLPASFALDLTGSDKTEVH